MLVWRAKFWSIFLKVKAPASRGVERVSRKLIIVTSPLGWPQEEIYGNPYERHVSEWNPWELIQFGYSVKVVDAVALPKTLRLVDRIRRALFRLPHPYLIIAHKCL